MITENVLSAVDKTGEVMKVLTYYNIFRHPMRIDEIHKLLSFQCRLDELEHILNTLCQEKKIFFILHHYALSDNDEMVLHKIRGEEAAAVMLPKAGKAGLWLSRFPFVRFVGISGSLSKQYADKNTDFDFFIITAPKRLWVARTILHLFKKLTFITGSQKYFCMNYFIDENNLTFEDRNIFVLNELATLIPVNNYALYRTMLESNAWAMQQLPQFEWQLEPKHETRSIVKLISESVLNLLPMNVINKSLMNFTDKRWKRKWAKAGYPMEDYDLAFRTREGISKNHPRNHQKIIMNKFSEYL